MSKQYIEVEEDGSTFFYKDKKMTKLHREDGPAAEWADGTKVWYLNGKCHREDGPAVVWSNGDKAWFRHDKLHREDGPAFEYADGSVEWYLNDVEMDADEFLAATLPIAAMTLKEIAAEYDMPVQKLASQVMEFLNPQALPA